MFTSFSSICLDDLGSVPVGPSEFVDVATSVGDIRMSLQPQALKLKAGKNKTVFGSVFKARATWTTPSDGDDSDLDERRHLGV